MEVAGEQGNRTVVNRVRFHGARALSTLYAAALAADDCKGKRPVFGAVRLAASGAVGVQVVGCDTFKLLVADLDRAEWEGNPGELLIPRGAIRKVIGTEARRGEGRSLVLEVYADGGLGLCSYVTKGGTGGKGGKCRWWWRGDFASGDGELRDGQYPSIERVVPDWGGYAGEGEFTLEVPQYLTALGCIVGAYGAGGGCGRIRSHLGEHVNEEGKVTFSLGLEVTGADLVTDEEGEECGEVVEGLGIRADLGVIRTERFPTESIRWAYDARLVHPVLSALQAGLGADVVTLWHPGQPLSPFKFRVHDEGAGLKVPWARLVVMPMAL